MKTKDIKLYPGGGDGSTTTETMIVTVKYINSPGGGDGSDSFGGNK